MYLSCTYRKRSCQPEKENALVAFKSRVWKLGLDKNNPESTLNKHKDISPVGSADFAAFLSKYTGNVIARNWKILLDFYGNEEMNEDLNECEFVTCSVKSKSPLSNAEVGATEDLSDDNSSPCELVEHNICCKHKFIVYSLIVCHIPE